MVLFLMKKLESLYIFRPLIFLWHTEVLMVWLLTLLSWKLFVAISLIVQLDIAQPLILSDSLHIAEQLKNVPQVFCGNLMHTCRSLITNNKLNLKICWIPGHRNIQNNDTVDYLARKALSNEVSKNIISHTLLDVYDWVFSDVMTKWNNRIPFQTTGVVYHKTFPNGRSPSLSLLPRKKDNHYEA
jgi:hypothetical protein